MSPGTSNRSRRWSSRPSWRDSARMRSRSRMVTGASGLSWRRDTPRKLGNCSEPRPPPTPDRPSTTCGENRSPPTPTPTRAAGTVPGHHPPPPTSRPPAGPSRTPGHPPMGTAETRPNSTTGTRNPITSDPHAQNVTADFPPEEAFLYIPSLKFLWIVSINI